MTRILTLSLILFFCSNNLYAASLNSAKRNYHDKDLEQAQLEYTELLRRKPDDELSLYGLGCVQYSKGDYETALENFQRSLLTEDNELESKALYNMANTKYRLAKAKQQQSLEDAIETMREALDYYKRSIDKNNDNDNAKFNHEFVERELKRLLEEMQNQEQNKQQDQEDQQEQQDQKNKDQEEQSQKDSGDEQKGSQDKSEQKDQEKQEKDSAQGEQESRADQDNSDKESQEDQREEGQGFQMSKQEAENILDKFSMQESDEFIKPPKDLETRGTFYKDW